MCQGIPVKVAGCPESELRVAANAQNTGTVGRAVFDEDMHTLVARCTKFM